MSPPHGTRTRYLAGCGCVDCKAAHRDYMRRYRAERQHREICSECGQLAPAGYRKAGQTRNDPA